MMSDGDKETSGCGPAPTPAQEKTMAMLGAGKPCEETGRSAEWLPGDMLASGILNERKIPAGVLKRGGPDPAEEFKRGGPFDPFAEATEPVTVGLGVRALEVLAATEAVRTGMVRRDKVDRELRVPPGFHIREVDAVAAPEDLVWDPSGNAVGPWQRMTAPKRYRDGRVVLERVRGLGEVNGLIWHIDEGTGCDRTGVGSEVWPFASEEGALHYLRVWYRDTLGRLESDDPRSSTEVIIDVDGGIVTKQLIKPTSCERPRVVTVPVREVNLKGYGKLRTGCIIKEGDRMQLGQNMPVEVPKYMLGSAVKADSKISILRKYTPRMKLEEMRTVLQNLAYGPHPCGDGAKAELAWLQKEASHASQLFNSLFPPKAGE